MDFIHLHNHTDYSVLDGAITIDKLISKSVEMGMPGVALTDHGNMFGAIEFYQKARKAGIKPIIGQEFYVAPGSRFDRAPNRGGKEKGYHLLLLAQDVAGYKNLIKLSSIGYLEGFYYKPRIDLEVLEKHSKGIICGSACLGGEIPVKIVRGDLEAANAAAGRFREIFGKNNFYLEMQDHNIPEQKTVNSELIKMSSALDIPLIATNDCHYLNKDDVFSHEVMLCIQTQKTIDDENRMRFSSDQFYFKSPEEMHKLFRDYPDALYNTHRICEMVDVELELGNPILPNFTVPDGFTLDTYLRHLVDEGAHGRYGSEVPDDVVKRNEYELSVILGMGFSGYFLIVWDFINYAKEKGIPVGPGRGSAAGSMVSYCLGITELDPLKYDLLFERFLNPDRNEMPDMDIDFCANRREDVIDYVKEKYGADHVSQIITFNTLKSKAVIKDVARVLDIPFAESNLISKMITEDSLSEALKKSADFKGVSTGSEKGKMLVDISLKLEGLVRSVGKHAAGVVISKGPLDEYVPLYRDSKDGSVSSQYEKGALEEAGLVKMDFLGLRNLTIIDSCRKLIESNRGEKIDISTIPLDDPETYKLLQSANTLGVFQLESSGMQNILRKLGPTCFEDIIAVVALYRPGPLGSGMVDDFIERKRNPKKVAYSHKLMEPILQDTLGVIVYQEQVMLISQVMGGFSLPEADKLRKAMGKKIPEIIQQMEAKFLKGAKTKKIDEKIAKDTFDLMAKFGLYGFNKSHSAAYALVSYQTAYLKANYRIEYMTALISSQPDDQECVRKYTDDCRINEIKVLPPDINRSSYHFSVEGDAIRFGLSAIKGIGEKAIESVVNAREKAGEFPTLYDVMEDIDLMAVNKGALESMIKAGVFDSLHENRAQLFMSIDIMLETARSFQADKQSGQGNLFGADYNSSTGQSDRSLDFPHVREWHDNEKLNYEKTVLGLYMSGHPLAKYEKELKALSSITIPGLAEMSDGSEVALVGIISNLKKRISKMGKPFAISMIEDMEGSIEAVFFNKILTKYEQLIESDEPIVLKGKLDFDGGDLPKKIIVNEVKTLKERRRDAINAVHLKFDLVGLDDKLLEAVKSIIQKNKGDCNVYFHLGESKGEEKVVKVHSSYNITPSDELISDLSNIIGKDSVGYSVRGY